MAMVWLIVGYAFYLAITATASYVALFVDDGGRREMAYRVLKLLLGAAPSVGAFVLVLLQLRESVM